MIVKGAGRTDARQLAAYLQDYDKDFSLAGYLAHEKNERTEVLEIKRGGSRSLDESIRGWEAEAKGSRCKTPLWHAQMRTPAGEALTREQQLAAVDILEKHLGFTNQPRAVVIHQKDGHEHIHVVWSRIRREEETIEVARRVGKRDKTAAIDTRPIKVTTRVMGIGTAKETSHSKRKNVAAAREIEERFGLQQVDSPNFANADKTKSRQTRREEAQKSKDNDAEKLKRRTKSAQRDERMGIITRLWEQTDSGKAMQVALRDAGYTLAYGDRRDYVVVDQNGAAHSLARQICIKDVRIAQVRERMADIDPASIPQVKHVQTELWRARMERQFEADAKNGAEDAEAGKTQGTTPTPRKRNDDDPDAYSLDPEKILASLTRRQSTFTKGNLYYDIGRRLGDDNEPAKVVRIAAAVGALDNFVPLGKDHVGTERFTSLEMLRTEVAMRDSSDDLASRTGHGIFHKLREAAPSYRGLSDQQKKFVDTLASGPGDLKLGIGYAGSGKSRAMKAYREMNEAGGYRLRGLALSGIAAQSLQDGSGIDSRTLASFFYQLEKLPEQAARLAEMNARIGRMRHDSFETAKRRAEAQARRDMFAAQLDATGLTKRDVVVLDEAGMVGSRDMGRLLAAAHKAGAKVVLIGDAEQLQAIDAGGAFRTLYDRHGAVKLDEIWRQKEDWAKKASKDFGDGFTAEALKAYADRGHIHSFDGHTEARAKVIADWTASRKDHASDTHLMLAFTRADVAELNAQAREAYKSEHRLGIDEDVQTHEGKRSFARGDRMYFLENKKLRSTDNDRELIAVKNGTLGTVEKIEGFTMSGYHRMTVRLDNGSLVQFSTEDYKKFDHGYAATIHKSQGVTTNRSFVLASQFMDRHAAYVAMSRHVDQADMYYSAAEFKTYDKLVLSLSRDRRKDTTLDYLRRAEAEGQPEKFWDRLKQIIKAMDPDAIRKRAAERMADLLNINRDPVEIARRIRERELEENIRQLKRAVGERPDLGHNRTRDPGYDFGL